MAQEKADPAGFPYSIAGGGRGTLEIIDVHGRVVRRFDASGAASLEWDGTDGDGAPVANGIYVYRLTGGGFSVARKLSLVR